MNKVILFGHIGQDCETQIVNGSQLIKFSLATNSKYVNKSSGEIIENVCWHNLQYWNDSEKIINHLKKGKKVLVEAKLNYSKTEDKYFTNLYVDKITLV